MTTPEFDDETLMAFADGELDDATTAIVQDAIDRDEALMARVALFMETRTRARDAMAPLLDQPASLKLERTVRGMVEASRASGERSASAAPRRTRRLAALAAALVAVIASGVIGYQLGGGGRAALQMAGVADPTVTDALSRLPSGGQSPLAGGAGLVRIVASFRTPDGAFCREYEIDPAEGASLVAVSCREGEEWAMRFAVATPVGGAGYAPASSTEALEAYLSAIEAGPALSAEDEASALAALR